MVTVMEASWTPHGSTRGHEPACNPDFLNSSSTKPYHLPFEASGKKPLQPTKIWLSLRWRLVQSQNGKLLTARHCYGSSQRLHSERHGAVPVSPWLTLRPSVAMAEGSQPLTLPAWPTVGACPVQGSLQVLSCHATTRTLGPRKKRASDCVPVQWHPPTLGRSAGLSQALPEGLPGNELSTGVLPLISRPHALIRVS